MTLHGRNTPESVLRFIGAHLDRIPEPVALARELGYDDEAIVKLQDKHGDGLLSYLKRVQRQSADTDRYLARQQGRDHPEQYSSSHLGAIDDLPTVPKSYEPHLAAQRLQRAEELLESMLEAEASLRAKVADVDDPLVKGELKRALSQIEKACEKARRKVATYELDRAA